MLKRTYFTTVIDNVFSLRFYLFIYL